MSIGMQVFPPKEDNALHQRVDDAWDFIEGFPIPKFEMRCVCGSTDLKVCAFTYCYKDPIHISQKGGTEYACAMIYRCITCGENREFSAAIPEETFRLRSNDGQAAIYHWEKALAVIEG